MAKRKPTIHKASAGRKPSSKRAPPSKNVRAIADLRRKNAQLTRELSKALDRQIATGDVLKVISRSTFDLQAVLQMLTETAARLCDADMASIARQDEAGFYQATNYNFPPDWVEYSRAFRTFAGRGSISGRALLDGKAVQVADVEADPEYTYQEQQKKSGYRTFLAVPLLRNGQPVVLLNLARTSVRPFTEKQIELVSTFADQAVIAIENARLFNEVQARTNDLSESLQQQTATAEILSVISSSPGDLAPVFEAMLSKAMNLCGANFGVLNTFDGKSFHTGATYGLPPAYDEFRRNRTLEYGPGTAPARLLEGEPYVEFVDLLDSEAYRSGEPNRRALVDLGGARSLLAVPLLKDERVVGSVMIFRQERSASRTSRSRF
jgi:GAF domain-containing protein